MCTFGFAFSASGSYQLHMWLNQIQSNALAALEVIDKEVAEQVFANGVVTGDRINGLCDGLTGDW